MPRLALALAALACLGAAPRAPMHLGPKAVAAPRRIVTLAPSLTETVLALGAGDRVVGVSRFDDAPSVKDLPKIGGYSDPSVEAVVALRPDLVLCEPSPGNRTAVERMAALGTSVLAVPLGSEEEIRAALREVGAALGLAEKGEALAKETQARVAAVRARARAVVPVRALVVYDWDPLVVSGPGSFGDGMLNATGATNAADAAKTPYPVFSAELAVRAAPQVIVDAADVREAPRERLLGLPGLSQARVAVASPSLFRPGPRYGQAVEELFGLLHPDAAGKKP
ncbi:MAG TPA: helical backbone metal receptor [Myxococcales bacterium]|jgi:iron complex transport system substrate-binding protein